MVGHLHGFKSFLDLLAEGSSRQAERIGGRGLESSLQLAPVTASAKVIKFPLTGHQKARLFAERRKSTVDTEH